MAIWAIVPAAGIGARMRSSIPKQYQILLGEPVLSLTLQRLLQLPELNRIMVALHESEFEKAEVRGTHNQWQQVQHKFQDNPRIATCCGGYDRHQSVLNALEAFGEEVKPNDWILVHDAVRPCVWLADIRTLISNVQDHAVGGLLGMPVRDTLKQVGKQKQETAEVERTLERSHIWAALTPQIFRCGLLREALQHTRTNGVTITDESSAMETMGHRPTLVQGRSDNIKITHPEDLLLAQMILTAQRRETGEDLPDNV